MDTTSSFVEMWKVMFHVPEPPICLAECSTEEEAKQWLERFWQSYVEYDEGWYYIICECSDGSS
jgi:hypothetical protein